MRLLLLIALALVALSEGQTRRRRRKTTTPAPTEEPLTSDELLAKLKKDVGSLKDHLKSISRQLMLQQFFTEEKNTKRWIFWYQTS